jgi:hypothetical protein
MLIITAAYVAWMLSMPLLPTEDGPVHLYYAQILSRLIWHTHPATAQFFRIKHLFPPYSLYYYALVLLGRFLPFLLADRIVVCVYFVLFVFGFRYFAKAVGDWADTAALFATLLLLNWPLGMGFVNFDLALALALWAAGSWLRLLQEPRVSRQGVFVVLAAVIMLTHPVPLLVLLAFAGLTLVIQAIREGVRRRGFAGQVVTLGLATLTLGYVKLFTRSNPLNQVDRPTSSFSTEAAHRAFRYASESGISFLNGRAPLIRAYRIGLMLVLVAAVVLAVQQWRRNRSARTWTFGDSALLCFVVLVLALPFIPPSVNGSTHFADRLLIFAWITAMIAAAGFRPPTGARHPASRWIRPTLILVAVVLNACLLVAANRFIRPLANSIAVLESLPDTYRGRLGLIVEDLRDHGGTSYANPTWDPYMWAPVHLFRHEDAVLANPPWLDLAIIPVGAKPALPASWIPQRLDDMPLYLARDLAGSPADRSRVLSSVDFIFITQPFRPPASMIEPMSGGDEDLDRQWPCQPGASSWYRICTRSSAQPPR